MAGGIQTEELRSSLWSAGGGIASLPCPWAGVLGFSSAHQCRKFWFLRIFHHSSGSRWGGRIWESLATPVSQSLKSAKRVTLPNSPIFLWCQWSLYVYLNHLSIERIWKVCLGIHWDLWSPGPSIIDASHGHLATLPGWVSLLLSPGTHKWPINNESWGDSILGRQSRDGFSNMCFFWGKLTVTHTHICTHPTGED